MLVLAMEFSRGVRRPQGARAHLIETGALAPFGRTSGRADPRVGRHRFGGTDIAQGCSSSRDPRSLPQNGIVMPTAIRRAHSLTDGTSGEVRSARGGSTGDSE
jgi:hypothetical protein